MMNEQVEQELDILIDQYVESTDLKQLFKQFIEQKKQEQSVWGMLTVYSHRMLGGESPDIFRAAAITELLLLLLDIIDDLQDQDNHSMPWMACSPAYTLNIVLSIFAAVIGELGKLSIDSNKASKLLMTSITGQQADISRAVVTEQDYVAMVFNKSGSLLQLACYMGYGLIHNLDEQTEELMSELANIIGMISQLENDIRDVVRWDKKNDIWQRKHTLPTIYLLSFSIDELPILNQYYDGTISEQQFLEHKKECLDYIHSSGCVDYGRVIQTLYLNRAREIIDAMTLIEPWKQRFEEATLGTYESNDLPSN
jgi:competence protein ComQ